MTRPTDWWVLDLDGDPTPGSPSAVRAMARRWHQVADDAAWAQRRVRQLMGDSVLGAWIGEAGDAFRSRASELPTQLGQCADSYGQAASALSWWADRLEEHQSSADRALARGRVARRELERAEESAREALHEVNALTLVPAGFMPSPEQVHDAQARLASAKAAQSHADAAVADARSRLDAARRLAEDALSLRSADGRTTAARIREAADAGIPERSRWEKLKDLAHQAWHVVVEVVKVVVAVLGVVVLILGGPLAWVVLAASIVLLVDAIVRYAHGDGSPWELALGLLGCIPGSKGLTSAAELAAFFRQAASYRSIGSLTADIKTWMNDAVEVRRVLLSRDEVGEIGKPKSPKVFLKPTNPPAHPPKVLPEGVEVRVMGPTDDYPRGYWRLWNGEHYLDPSTMRQPRVKGRMTKAVFNSMTHVELPK